MMRKSLSDIVVFFDRDLPSMASHCEQSECGYSLYRGILVQWDEDHDERVLKFIDALGNDVQTELLVVQEHEGRLGLLWRDRVPQGLEEGRQIDICNDVWSVESSVTAPREPIFPAERELGPAELDDVADVDDFPGDDPTREQSWLG
jgi:hypothetical protein